MRILEKKRIDRKQVVRVRTQREEGADRERQGEDTRHTGNRQRANEPSDMKGTDTNKIGR